MEKSDPVSTMVIYRVKPGTEERFEPLLKKHWPVLAGAGLVTPEPAKFWRAHYKREENRVAFVEIFAWKDETASGTAHQMPEVMQVWEPMGEFLEGMELYHLERIES
jgi:hypothetical protein